MTPDAVSFLSPIIATLWLALAVSIALDAIMQMIVTVILQFVEDIKR